MWVEELTIENIKGFEKINLRFSEKKEPVHWITLLGENGGGKSTVLQSLGLLLAGPENINELLPVPHGWVRDEQLPGKLTIKIHQGNNDPGTFGERKTTRTFSYTYFITGKTQITIRNRVYTSPSIVENPDRRLTWLKQNALSANAKGWFAAGYGAFRRLTRENRVLVPSISSQQRHNNFTTQFKEDEALSSFEQWMVYLDYRIAKGENGAKNLAKHQMEIAVEAINKILPKNVSFDSVSEEGKILFDVNGTKVSTLNLSDGYRSILALMGDLIWRMLDHFPDSEAPLHEEGIVLIDELDIHLHPVWQRHIALLLQEQFPNIQFIVATHSPIITAGAGPRALTYRLVFDGNKTLINEIEGLAFMSIDNVLASEAFSLVSPFSPQTEQEIQKYFELKKKDNLSAKEEVELEAAIPFVKNAYAVLPSKEPLFNKMENYLKTILQ